MAILAVFQQFAFTFCEFLKEQVNMVLLQESQKVIKTLDVHSSHGNLTELHDGSRERNCERKDM